MPYAGLAMPVVEAVQTAVFVDVHQASMDAVFHDRNGKYWIAEFRNHTAFRGTQILGLKRQASMPLHSPLAKRILP